MKYVLLKLFHMFSLSGKDLMIVILTMMDKQKFINPAVYLNMRARGKLL